MSSTLRPIACENGGTPDSSNQACICPPHFTGRLCSSVESAITPEIIQRPILVNLDLNQEFLPDYNNPSSSAYRQFVSIFSTAMSNFYRRLLNSFDHVTGVTLSEVPPLINRRTRQNSLQETAGRLKPSVRVRHNVVFNITNNGNLTSIYADLLRRLREVLREAINNPDASLPFRINNFTASSTNLSAAEVCEDVTASLNHFQQLYAAVEIDGRVTCVSQCHRSHPHPRNCFNGGVCEVLKQGATCFCYHTDVNWFLGSECSVKVNKIGTYAGIGVVTCAVVIIVAVLTAYLIISNRKLKRNKDIKKELVQQWLDEDFEWTPRSSSSEDRVTYENQGYAVRRDSEESYRVDFPPSPSFARPSLQIPSSQRVFSIRTNRPQIRTSVDI